MVKWQTLTNALEFYFLAHFNLPFEMCFSRILYCCMFIRILTFVFGLVIAFISDVNGRLYNVNSQPAYIHPWWMGKPEDVYMWVWVVPGMPHILWINTCLRTNNTCLKTWSNRIYLYKNLQYLLSVYKLQVCIYTLLYKGRV